MAGGGQAPRGTVFKTVELTSRIRDDNPIMNLPFDFQELTVELELPGSTSKEHTDHNR
jgi:hypothetical protein